MGNAITTWAAVCLSVTSTACAPLSETDSEPPPPLPAPAEHAAPPWLPDLVAFTAAGDLAVVDGVTGAVRSKLAAGAGGDRDLVWDPWAGRVVAYQAFEGDEGGEIVAYPIRRVRHGFLLGARTHLAWVDGRARLLPAPLGMVVFEEGYGSRWKLLGPAVTPSLPAPPPQSAWITVSPTGAVVHALSRDEDGALAHHRAQVMANGLAMPESEAIGAGSMAARLVPAPAAGDAVIVDVAGASLAVRAANGPTSFLPLPAANMRIEAAVPLHGGAVVALLMSGSPSIVAVALDADGVPWSVAHLPLAGDVAPADRMFGRDLAVQGQRLLAATSAGVHAVRVAYNEVTGVDLMPAAGFGGSGLRGPFAVLNPSP